METLLKNGRVLDVDSGDIRLGDVLICGDQVTDVALKLNVSSTASQEIDLEGAYLLPGLISCHTHLTIVFPFSESDPNEHGATSALRAYRRGRDALLAGITTVRTVGELNRADLHLRQAIQKGWVTGPRIFSAGLGVSVTGGHGHGFTAETDGADGFRRACREDLLAGADHIKIFLTGGIAHASESLDEAQMAAEEIAAAVSVARSKGTYVCAHAGDSEPIQRGLDQGVACFEHAYNLNRDVARNIKSAGGYVVPTLAVTRSSDWMRRNSFEGWTICKAVSSADDHLTSIRNAIGAGIPIVNGTDIPPGDVDDGIPVAIREMEHCMSAGLDSLQAIQTATTNAAALIGQPDLGVIRSGAKADLIAMQENPLEDVRHLANLSLIVAAGKIVKQAAL